MNFITLPYLNIYYKIVWFFKADLCVHIKIAIMLNRFIFILISLLNN